MESMHASCRVLSRGVLVFTVLAGEGGPCETLPPSFPCPAPSLHGPVVFQFTERGTLVVKPVSGSGSTGELAPYP